MLLAEQGFISLQNKQVAVKHMIVLSDGDPAVPWPRRSRDCRPWA